MPKTLNPKEMPWSGLGILHMMNVTISISWKFQFLLAYYHYYIETHQNDKEKGKESLKGS